VRCSLLFSGLSMYLLNGLSQRVHFGQQSVASPASKSKKK
jgi:hypothetical protein